MNEIQSTHRFLVGFISAPVVPLVKMFENLDYASLEHWSYHIGSVVPVLLLGVLMGFYAWLIERDESNVKRLFRTCVAMPSVLITLASGGSIESKAVAGAELIKCEKKNQLVQGIIDSVNALRSKETVRYLLVDRDKRTDAYIEHEGRWYVIARSIELPHTGFVYDMVTCTLMSKGDNDDHWKPVAGGLGTRR